MSLKEDIAKTINYAKKYDYRLTVSELEQRLISQKKYSNKKIEYFLEKNSEYKRQLKLKNEDVWVKNKIEKTKKLANLIDKKFGEILFLGITGSVSANNAKKNDDIDLIIITKKNCLWITRLKLRWFVYKNKIAHRKLAQKEKRNQFCFNLWLDEKALKIPKNKQNLRNAVDLILMKPVINKNKTYEKFLTENNWAKKFVANGYERVKSLSSFSSSSSYMKGDFYGFILNFLVFVPQYLWMRPKIKKEIINLHQAFFHKS